MTNSGFWGRIEGRSSRAHRGIFVLAPLANVTNVAFRRIIAKYGKPDVMWTEFVSADGLARAPEEGRKKLLKDLEYTKAERPIVAQFFTSNLEHMRMAAELAVELGFDGVDINMGCPDRSVEKQGAGAALIKNPGLARELIRAAKVGVRSTSSGQAGIPVSVKTRLGYNKDELETFLPELLAEEPAVVTIHARTRKEMSKVPARWDRIKRAVEIRDEFALRHAQGKNEHTLIFGNGDALDLPDAGQKVDESGADGVMLGRAIFGNPWLFAEMPEEDTAACSRSERGSRDRQYPPPAERLRVLLEHTKLFEELLRDYKSFAIMKKHFKSYVSGFDGAVELRTRLMEAENAAEVEVEISKFLAVLAE